VKKDANAVLLFLITLSLGGREFLSQGVGGPPRIANEGVPSGQGSVKGATPGGVLAVARLPEGVHQVQDGQFIITDSRPLEVVAKLLSMKLGVPIAFEEAAWASDRDVMRAADAPGGQGATSLNNPRGPLGPRGGTVDVSIPTFQSINPTENASNTIQAALNSHRSHKNPGDFKLVRFGEGEFSIVAERAENAAGVLVNQLSPLDARISFPEAERTMSETIEVIFQSIRNSGHASVTEFASRFQGFKNPRLRLGASNEIGRDVLAKAFRRPGGSKYSWSLRYDPENKGYLFFLVGVQAEVPIPGGGTGLRPLSWPK
jgi:hypothetical protein